MFDFRNFVVIVIFFYLQGCENMDKNMDRELSVGKIIAEYPPTPKIPVTETYFDTSVTDPYRWLEDDQSDRTDHWIESQNQLTADYIEQIPYRDAIFDRISVLWDYEKVGAPFKEGNYTYFYRNDGLQNQYVLYRYSEDINQAEVFIDPNTFSEDGTIALSSISFSEDGSLAA